jgi:hypothetical protein
LQIPLAAPAFDFPQPASNIQETDQYPGNTDAEGKIP